MLEDTPRYSTISPSSDDPDLQPDYRAVKDARAEVTRREAKLNRAVSAKLAGLKLTQPSENQYPPKDWQCEPGGYYFRGKWFYLSGRPHAIFTWITGRRLPHAPFTIDQLMDGIRKDRHPILRDTARNQLCTLRDALVKNHDLPDDSDPLPPKKGDGTWHLDSSVFKVGAK